MRVLIVEDEVSAARQTERMLRQLRPGWTIGGMTESISDTVEWLRQQPWPDLILMDIQLSDGECFAVFEQVQVRSPVIFTTAFDEYAIRAFKVNGIDYLLKPIEEEELEQALLRFERIYPGVPAVREEDLRAGTEANHLVKLMEKLYTPVRTRERILLQTHNGIRSVECAQIAYVKAQDKLLYIFTFNGDMYTTDQTLEELEQTLPARQFFRINRKYICHINALEKMLVQSQGRIRVELLHCRDDANYVSQSRIQAFRQWLDH